MSEHPDVVDGAIRVALVDDQSLVRTGFTMILRAAGIDVVGEASTGADAIRVVRETAPDVVLMDIRMPEIDGLEATRRIASEHEKPPRIIILTTFDLDRYVYAALQAGASGFLLKDVSPEQLVTAVKTISAGDALLAPTITRRLVERFARREPSGTALNRDLSALTPRELEVFTTLARGLSNTELAAHFQLSEATVKTHVARILSKLHLRDRAQAVVLGYESGLVIPSASTTGDAHPSPPHPGR